MATRRGERALLANTMYFETFSKDVAVYLTSHSLRTITRATETKEMNSNNRAIELNNLAVSQLQEGNYKAAVANLKLAYHDLTTMKNIKSCSRNGNAPSLRVKSSPIAPLQPGNAACQNVFDFYRRAFRIVSSQPETSDPIHIISNLIVVKFNLAIAYHDDAVRRDDPMHFRAALDVYQDILYLMKEYSIKGHMLLLLSIENNMGQCHMLNFPQTREALFWVRELAVQCQQFASVIPYDDFAFFYNTVIIFRGDDLCIAPAA